MQRSMKFMLALLIYALFLRMVLALTIPVGFFNRGLLLDGLFLIALFMLVSFVIPNKTGQKVFYGVFVVFFTFIVVADVIYHDYFFTLIARSNAQGLTLMSPSHAVEYDIVVPWYFVLLFIFGAVFIVFLVRFKQRDRLLHTDALFLVLIVLVQGLIAISFTRPDNDNTLDYYQSDAYLFASMHDRVTFAERYGYFYYHLVDLFRFARPVDETLAHAELDAYFATREPLVTNDYSGLFEGKNLIKITVESLDSRFIDPVLTPTLHMMKHEGYRFDNFYVPVFQQGATCNSEFMASTGLFAINSNEHTNNVCDAYKENAFPYALANQLKNAGYGTYYFHSGYRWFYNRETIIPQYGFETVKFQEDLIELGHIDFNDRLDTNLLRFVDAFVVFEEPFYLEFLTYGLHGAYNHDDYLHHDPIVDLLYDETLDPEFRVYFQKLIEFDLFLSGLIEILQTEGVYDDTVFVIYTDHYPYMLDQEDYGAFVGMEDVHSEERYHQTLIIYNSAMIPTRVDTVGATLDIVPTLLNLLLPSGEFQYFFGRDLLSSIDGYVLLQDMSVIDGTNRMHLLKPYEGDPDKQEALEAALEYYITLYELQKKLLEINYFKDHGHAN